MRRTTHSKSSRPDTLLTAMAKKLGHAAGTIAKMTHQLTPGGDSSGHELVQEGSADKKQSNSKSRRRLRPGKSRAGKKKQTAASRTRTPHGARRASRRKSRA